jgi:hypothetical chaperone protein
MAKALTGRILAASQPVHDRLSIGIDFGTTNTVVVAIALPGEPVCAAQFHDDRELSDIYRSVLCFEHLDHYDTPSHAGMKAIRAFLESVYETRFIQSFKSHVASRAFEETRIFNRGFRFEDLLSIFFRHAMADAAGEFDGRGARIVSGRPVTFVGAAPDETLALERYAEAYRRVGLADPAYVYEPVAAAYYYAQRLRSDALALVCDFGGGTSDFSLIRFKRRGNLVAATPLGHAGVGIAGDSFDYRIIDAVVSPHLGKGTLFRSFDKILPVPQHYHTSFARWHQLAMLKTPKHIRELERLERASLSPDKIAKLLDVIRNDWGFNIYRAVSDAKISLSSAESTRFSLKLGGLDIDERITREDFERWIAGDIARIERTVDDLLIGEGINARDVDSVFLTGGSSLIPAVRRIFAARFGDERLAEGHNFLSVAYGLALIGLENDVEPWLASPAAT